MKKGFDKMYGVALLALFIVWFLMSFYISKLPMMGRLDASVGCPFYQMPLIGGFLTGFIGCGFMSLFHIVMVIATLALIVIALKG